MSYLSRLDQLDYSRSLAAAPAQARVILLTGQSSFCSSRLSAAQTAFLRTVAPPASEPLLAGFPFHPAFDGVAAEPTLAAASVRNGLQFVWSLWTPRFQQVVARALQPLFQNTRKSLFIITGSCGLQLLACSWAALKWHQALDVRVIALGPALWRPFALDLQRVYAIQGRADALSRWCYRGAVNTYCQGGHLDYWHSQETREHVARLLRGNQ